MKIELTEEEVKVIDNELYVVVCRLMKEQWYSVDSASQTEEQKRYLEVVKDLRVRLGKLISENVIKNTKCYRKWHGDRFEEKTIGYKMSEE